MPITLATRPRRFPAMIEPPPTVTMRSAPVSRAVSAASITACRGVCGSALGAPLHAAALAMVIADPQLADRINFGPFIPTIRKWFGDDVVARLKDRLALPEDYTTSGPREE